MEINLGVTEYLIIIGATIFLYFQLKKRIGKYRNVPPGPRPIPFLGNVHQMTNKPQLKMCEWADTYGPMFSLFMGTTRAVVVNDLKLVKEMLFDSNFTDRPHIELFELFSGGHWGIIMTNGAQWEQQRRWVLRKLRDYGFGKTLMEGIIMDEVNEVVEHFKKNQNTPIIIKDRFSIAALNSLRTLMNGKRMSQEDPRIKKVLEAFHAVTPAIARSGLTFAPWLKHVFPGAYKLVLEAADEVMSYSRNAVAEHFDTHKDGQIRDFIDEYIEEIKATTDPNSSFYKAAGRKNLEAVVSDLIQAGAETSSNTIVWAICYLSHHQEKQKKIHAEIDAVLGSRAVTMSDKPNLPYTEAVILETLRKSSLVAGGVQHSAVQDKEVAGYMIPKDSWVMANIYYIHHDPKIWGDPENFRPERFLSPDGKKVMKHEALIPFQIGRRQCLGESLARDTLFLFVSTMFQQFKISKVEEEEPEPENGMFLRAQAYNFIFESRQA